MAQLASKKPERLVGVRSRGLSGAVAMSGGAAAFESSLEQDFLELLDFDANVSEVQVQPFSIYHEENGRRRRYTPDVRATYLRPERQEVVVYEVKYQDELRQDWSKFRPRFAAAYRHCREQGWRFKVVNEKHIRTQYLANVKFLRRFMRLSEQPLIVGQLLYTLKALGPTTPQALLAAAYWSNQPRLLAIPVLWKLIGEGSLGCDLNSPLTMASPIWMND